MRYEEGWSDGYNAGYWDCKTRDTDPQGDWEELERLLGVTLQPKDEPKPATVNATAQINPLPLP